MQQVEHPALFAMWEMLVSLHSFTSVVTTTTGRRPSRAVQFLPCSSSPSLCYSTVTATPPHLALTQETPSGLSGKNYSSDHDVFWKQSVR